MTVQELQFEDDSAKDYLSEINYHKRCIKDAEEKLRELMKDHLVIISL